MTRFIIAVLFVAFNTVAANSGEEKANAIQRQVWSQYLSEKDVAVLTNMLPEERQSEALTTKSLVDTIQASRDGFAAMAAEYAGQYPSIHVSRYDSNGVKGSWLSPDGATTDAVLLYIHGGAYVVGSDETPKSITAFLATEANIRCFSLDYPLAPEHPFPAAVDNAVQAYRMLLEDGYLPYRIVIGGDSAGGGLTLALLLSIREYGLPMPAGAYLISPWSDLTQSFETHELKSGVDMNITAGFLNESAEYYAGDNDRKNPLISPSFANLRGLPPLLIQVGSHERLLDDSLTITRNAALADVPTTLSVWPGYPHVFQFYHRDLEGGQIALGEAARFIQSVVCE